MADTRVQREAEAWVRDHALPAEFGQSFEESRLRLTSGGVFEFDAVSRDGQIVASVSTSKAKTATGRGGSGKLMKLRSDMYFLLLVEAKRRIIALTEPEMLELCRREQARGRVPSSIQFLQVAVPSDLRAKLDHARRRASKEVTPS